MQNKKDRPRKALPHQLCTRVDQRKFDELTALLAANPQNDMSTLLRDILDNRPIKVFTRDRTLDILMEELTRLRGELRAIGVNINQLTRYFNTYPEPRRKELYAAMAFKEYQAIQPTIEQILDIISKLGTKWLSG